MNELASWLWSIPIAVGAWLAGWLACDWRNGRHRRQEGYRLRLAKDKAYLRAPCKLWEENVERAVQIPTYPTLTRSSSPTTAATRTTGADTDTAQATELPLDIPCPTPTVDGLSLAVEDMSWVRRSSFRVVDSDAKTEET